jgi:exodeoxyribonuclease V gamma subunit
MLIVHQSNRVERLADALAEILASPPSAPLAPEVVGVQSVGMARWLALRLARQLGIAANLEFPFPATLLWRLFRTVLPDVPDQSPFGAEVLTWRVLGQLSEVAGKPGYEPLTAYLEGSDELGAYGLAEQLALLFDEYLVYRPDWVLAWEQGRAEHWQARLWRRMTRHAAPRHRVRLAVEFLERLRGHPVAPGLPERVSLFGLTALPPPHLHLFAALAEALDVHLFVLNPCQEYWGEIRDAGEITRRAGSRDPDALALESGNPLLASLGKQARDLVDRLQDLPARDDALFEDPGERSLLHVVQADILRLRNRGEGGDAPAAPFDPADRSIQVHSCHSPVREIEVLHDQLLALFEADPALTPADVAVLAPDITRYAPILEAVFGAAEPARRIPVQVSGRPGRGARSLTGAFFELLALPEGRCDSNQLLGLLEVEAVRRRFGIGAPDVEVLRDWVRAAGVRWGVDAADRAARGLPAVGDHTWRAGLDRLLLGYALPGEGRRCFAGILPQDDVEGEAAALLGRLVAFAEAVFAAMEDLRARRSVPVWADRLRLLIADFLDPDEGEEAECRRLLEAIAAMARHAGEAGFAGEVARGVVRECLEGRLEAAAPSAPLRTGAVTVAGLLPVRGLPFAVVCLVGLDDGAFPRPQRATGFDLLRQEPRPGDRSRRQDDRALFLEALLAARRVFYASYVGQHIRENSLLPPAAPVSELLDYCDRAYTSPEAGRPVRDWLVTRHPLQAFSPRYFAGDPRLPSYAADLCEASRAAAGARQTARRPFLQAPLPEPPEEWRQVSLDQLLRFFEHPARYLVRERLGIRLEEAEGLLEVREPFTLDALGSHQVRTALLAAGLDGRQAETAGALRAGGLLPHAGVGEVLLAREAGRAEAFAARVRARRPADRLEPLAIDLGLGPLRLRGRLGELSPAGRFVYRCGKTRVKDRLRLWVSHLLLNRLAPPAIALESWFLAEDGSLRLLRVAGAAAILGHLAELYWAGCRRAVPLLPESSYAFAVRVARDGSREAAWGAARTAWAENEFTGRGEETDPYHRLAFRDREPIDEEFAALAEAVFLPLLAHQAEA